MAARYWRGTGTGNFNSTTNWSATSGGATGASVPTSVDDIFFDANGNNNATVSATITVLSMTIDAGYTATMTHNAVLTVAGNVTLGANYTIAGSSSMTISATSTITSNGKTWPNNMTFTTGSTKTLVGNFTISGILTINATTTLNKTTSETLSVGGLTHSNGATFGTAKIIITGGTWSGTSVMNNDIDLNSAGIITLGTTITWRTGVLTYVTGTIVTTGSTLVISASCTLNTSGVSWEAISITADSTLTLTSALVVTNITAVNISFGGTFGATITNFTITSTIINTCTLVNGVTYTITGSLVANTTRVGAILLFTSNHASNKAILTLREGATCALLADMTRIDASNGRPIRTFNGVCTDVINIQSFYDLKSVAA